MYSEWKEWLTTDDNAKWPRAFDTTGGDSVGNNQEIAPYFFLRNDLGWIIKMPAQDGELVLSGNLFPRDASQSMFVQAEGYDAFLRLEVSTRAVVLTVPVPTEQEGLLTVEQAEQLAQIATVQENLTAYTGATLPQISATLVGTNALIANQGNWVTATGFSTFNSTNDTVTTDEASRIASKADVSGLSTFDNATDEVTTNTASRNASKADVSGLSTFDPATDTVANVTLVATTTTNTDMRGTDGVTIPSNLSTFDPATDTVANVTLVGTVTTNTDMRGTNDIVIPTNLSTFDPVNDAVANVTLVATTTTNTDMRGTDGANTIAPTTAPTVSEIRAGFVANDFKATTTISSNMRGTDNAITSVAGLSTFDASTDEVTTDLASRNASKADVSGLSTFDPTTDAVANVTLVATTTTNSDMRGTDGANTVAPVTPPTVVEIRAGFVADDFKATTTISSNMRGTDGAITSVAGLSTFDPATDTVANVTLVGTTTTNSDMRGTDGANTVAPDNAEIGLISSALGTLSTNVGDTKTATLNLQANQSQWLTADVSGLSTFDPATTAVITDEASRTASKADVSNLPTDAGLTDDQAAKLDEIAAIKANTNLIPALLQIRKYSDR